MGPIHDPERLADAFASDPPDVWLVSCGGCATNTMATYLEETRGVRIRTPIWRHLLCHAGHPIEWKGKALYMYAHDLSRALASQKRRGLERFNLAKMTNDRAAVDVYTDDLMLRTMAAQRDAWSEAERLAPDHVACVAYEDLWRPETLERLSRFLDLPDMRRDFPRQHEPKT